MRRLPMIGFVTAFGLALALGVAGPPAGAAPGDTGLAAAGLGQAGRWVTDGQGRVVILHGLNQVSKVAPYQPADDGFGDDDAAFLAANGFDAMRVGVIWAAVEPRPGVYDDAYLDSIAGTVRTLAAHDIVSLLDFHQDLYNEQFQGEGAPAWAVVQDGLLGPLTNPPLGFPGNYLANPAEWQAWESFWANRPAPDGVGLQDHYARAWAHVAARFAGDRAVAGYELLNEPWPGNLGIVCAVPLTGCPLFDPTLTAFYHRVASAIRTADPSHTVYYEPNVLFAQSATTYVGDIGDPHAGFAFHDYCSTEELTADSTLCPPQDELTISRGTGYGDQHAIPTLITEFGATNDLPNIAGTMSLADKYRAGWLEWAYTGHDKTSSSPDGQALVLDPSQPPTGANVLADKLKVLAEPYPQAVAGTPSSWSWSGGTFQLAWSTARADGTGRFGAGAETDVAVPAVQFPAGYRVTVTGAQVTSAPGAPTLRLVGLPGATDVSVTVTAA